MYLFTLFHAAHRDRSIPNPLTLVGHVQCMHSAFAEKNQSMGQQRIRRLIFSSLPTWSTLQVVNAAAAAHARHSIAQ